MVILPEEIIWKIMLYLRHPTATLMVNKYKDHKCPLFTTLNYYLYIYKLPNRICIDYNNIYMKERYRYTILESDEEDQEEE